MILTFTDQDLRNIKSVVDANGERGIRAAFFWWGGIPETQQVQTNDVEDFALAFMSQYNTRFGTTF